MEFETLKELAAVLVFLIVAGCIVSIFGFRFRRPKPPRVEMADAAPLHTFERAIEREMTTSEERAHVDHARFRKLADERLEPLLNALVDRAREHNCEARYEVKVDADATKYRLEVKRPDHPAGQPLPCITFSAADGDQVEVVYGGVFPGPSDHNRLDPEVGWRTVRWDQVDDIILTFTHKVLAHFD